MTPRPDRSSRPLAAPSVPRQNGTPLSSRRNGSRPRRIGQYRPQELLGSGGMAAVYLATGSGRLGARRCCALKVLHDKLSDREVYLDMFLNEARIASEISHPHVCNVFDYGCSNGQPYLAMDYLLGKSLADLSRAWGEYLEPAPHARRMARILADTCEGLSAIHEYRSPSEGHLNVVHRDISPDNIILGFDGFVKIIDFGLAKVACRGEKTQSGILKGKISYIAPELLRGEEAGASADIWSLGVVAWELLTGKRLFRKGSDAETLRAISEQPVPAPSSVLAGLPPELDRIVLRALERHPAHRYPTAAALGADLWTFLRAGSHVVQHRELADWLTALFPGVHEQMLHSIERVTANALAEPMRTPRSARLLQNLRGRIGRTLPTEPRTRLVAALAVAAALLALGVFRWSVAGPSAAWPVGNSRALAPASLAASEPLQLSDDPPPTLAHVQSPAGFVVEVEREGPGSEVIVHVRAATPASEPVSLAR